jgi:trehalose 6-phosphate synthase/phosphatase
MADGRLVVVSNRLPLTLRPAPGGAWRTDQSAGGLATAMGPIMSRTGGVWVGWPGDASAVPDPGREAELRRWRDEHGYVAVDLPSEVALRFYEGFANRSLWPLFHQFPTRLQFDSGGWDAYVEANQRFRDAALEVLAPGDVVWIHDYHLMLLPQMLREAAPSATIGFFLHIPFPNSEMFRILPRRAEVLRGLLGADLLGFQTFSDLQHFRSSLLRVLGYDSRMDRVVSAGRVTRLEALPIGIAPDDFISLLREDADTAAALARYRQRFQGWNVLLAVDRLDYTKGLPQRLRAYRRLLERAPHLRGKVVLVQVAVPSRENIAEYTNLRRAVNGLVGEINGDFGTPDWTPVSYVHRGIPRSELVALYALADVGWVTPLRDGMNLVAKEYVACQDESGDAALVLSEFAGAAAEMGEAFVVNPYDEERTAEAVEAALSLPADERRARMAALRRRVARNNVFAWSERFLTSLRQAGAERGVRLEQPADLPRAQAVRDFREARRRLLILDYDGTLVGYTATPRQATPPPELLNLLGRLSGLPATTVCLLSGRARADLDRWFAGVRGLAMAAEHGALMRPAGGEWTTARPGADTTWKSRVLPVLEHYADRTPGSFIEEKEHCLVWHYRLSDPEFGDWVANELVHNLEQMLAETESRAMRGHKAVEVRPAWAHKGSVVGWLEADGPADFRLGMGDDRTDEDLFEQLPPDAWTVRVGQGSSRARFRLPDPRAVRAFLDELARAQS